MARPRAPTPDASARALDRLADLLRGRERTLSDYHECAGLIVALRPAGAGYGSAWVRTLCATLATRAAPLSLSLAYRLVKFAELFPGPAGVAEVRRLEGKVSWEVVMRVLHVEDPAVRADVLRRAEEQGLSSRAAIALIRERGGYRRSRGGRAPARPSTHPNRALHDLRVVVAKWNAVHTAWAGGGNDALKRAGRLKAAQVTDAFLTDLGSVVPLVEEITRTAEELAGGLAVLLRTLETKRGESVKW